MLLGCGLRGEPNFQTGLVLTPQGDDLARPLSTDAQLGRVGRSAGSHIPCIPFRPGRGQSVPMTATQTKSAGLEIRSIDYVPLAERHGKIWHLGPLWFMSNAQIATLAVGLISISEGASLFWSVLSILIGTLVGTLFMAFHSAQGPQLGLPQMIQSRAQFGYLGALLVWLFAYVQYAGFNVFNSILGGEAMSRTAHGSTKVWVVVITIVAFVVALVGYDLIHRAEQVLTYAMLVIFGIFTIALFLVHYPAGTFDIGSFKATPFLGQFGVVAGYQISWAIYVSDYSRYMSPDVTVRKTFYWTYWGSAIGGAWMMVVGSVLAAWAGASFDGSGIAEIDKVGDHIFTGFGAIVLILAALGLMSVMALNMYGGSLTLISAIDSFSRVRPTVSLRIITVGITGVLSVIGALAATTHFLTNFNNFLLLILYLFIPWTAVNLVDYYVVRRGHYAIAEIFKPAGIYGRWGWRGITAYVIGFAAMVPFFDVGTLYEGVVAKSLNGADISFFIGLPVAGILYWLFSRSIDVASEIKLAQSQAAELETVAAHHEVI
jgi:NCS1 family nucleobase:cation symporter-1